MQYKSKPLKITAITLKILIVLIAIGAIVFVIEENYAFRGIKTFNYDFEDDSYFISHLEPWERLSPITEVDKEYFQEMQDDTIYFNVKKPGMFDTVTIKVTYENQKAPLLDLGLRVNKKDNYIKIPLESKIIDQLSWISLNQDEIILFQKEKKFISVSEFLNNFPSDKKVIAHNFDIKKYVEEEKIVKENITPLRHDADLEDIDYLITVYKSPQNKNSLSLAQNTFEFKKAYIDEDEMMRFMLTAPGLKETNETIKIHQVEIIFERPPISKEKVTNKIRKFFKL